jgi:hypothetical protein
MNEFQRFEMENENIIYVENHVMEEWIKKGVLTFYVEGYGRYQLEIY